VAALKMSIICMMISVCGLALSAFAWNVGLRIAGGAGVLAILLMLAALYDAVDD
jgi:hypothetical protein